MRVSARGVADAVADISPAHDNSHKPQGERSRKMRARILSAAINLLREKGYSAFRVADVAESAGVSRGAQLHHFPTTDQLVAACLEQVFSADLEKDPVATGQAIEAHGHTGKEVGRGKGGK